MTARQLKLLTAHAYLSAGSGFASEPKSGGNAPVPQPAVLRIGAAPRGPWPFPRLRPGAGVALALCLSRLDDMKAEDTLTIDLRDKASVGDYMVVSSGRSQRHVG